MSLSTALLGRSHSLLAVLLDFLEIGLLLPLDWRLLNATDDLVLVVGWLADGLGESNDISLTQVGHLSLLGHLGLLWGYGWQALMLTLSFSLAAEVELLKG